jgi:hypothetical protein
MEAEVLTAIEFDDDHVQAVIERGVEESPRDTLKQRARRCRDDLRLTAAIDPRQQARLLVAAQIADLLQNQGADVAVAQLKRRSSPLADHRLGQVWLEQPQRRKGGQFGPFEQHVVARAAPFDRRTEAEREQRRRVVFATGYHARPSLAFEPVPDVDAAPEGPHIMH